MAKNGAVEAGDMKSSAGGTITYRTVGSGQFVRVMDKGTYKRASDAANSVIHKLTGKSFVSADPTNKKG